MVLIWFAVAAGSVAAAARLASGRLLGAEAARARGLGAFVLAWAWITLGTEGLGSLGLLLPPALAAWSVLGLAAAALVARRSRPTRPAPTVRPVERFGLAATLALGLVLWAAWGFGLRSALDPVKVVSDGPIYHLYFAARWWKAGRVFPVASPFGEVGATYFWANGELWYAWLMTLMGGDRLAKVGQAPFFLASGAASYAMARRLNAGASASLLASCWFLALIPLLLFGFEPNVDALFVAGYLVACFFFLRHAMGDDDGPSVALGALAAGLGLATKPTGVVFFPPLLVLIGLRIAVDDRPARRKLRNMAILAGLTALMAGFWPIRNAWLTGNPLYPLRVEVLGRTWLRGWFGPGAMAKSPYYLPMQAWGSFADTVLGVLDPRLMPGWALALAGAWAIGRPGRREDRWGWGFAALAVVNVALYWLVIPYRTQQRFMLHGLGLAAVPLALLFDRAAWIRAVAVGLLGLHLLTPTVWPIAVREADIPWDRDPAIPNVSPPAIRLPFDPARIGRVEFGNPFWVGLVLGVGSMGLATLWTRLAGRPSVARRAGAAAGTVAVGLAGTWAMGGPSRLPVPPFPDYFRGWMELESRSGPAGVRVAYAGTNIPYYLMGGLLRNDVRYVNVDEHRDWLMHDYHRAAASRGLPETWDDPFPGWDRVRPDYEGWLGNLQDAGIEILVVARVNREQGAHNVATADGFPIEEAWAEGHPESFEPLYGVAGRDPRMRLYRVIYEKPGRPRRIGPPGPTNNR